jgi:phytoene desaturase
MYDTIVVGAGLGGLAAALRLARAGRRVLVLEKNARAGGKLNLVARDGFCWDTGPSLLTMPWVLRELFAACGQDADAALELVRVEPTCRYFFPDGARFDAWQSLPELAQEIDRLSPGELPRFFAFLAYAGRIYEATAESFLLRPLDGGLRDMFNPRLMRDSWKLDAFRSVDAAAAAFFKSPHLRQVIGRYATYNGSSPYLAPATFNVIPYIEFVEGGWYLRGGMYGLARALLGLAEELGVELRTESPVAKVLFEGRRAVGVQLADGEQLRARDVVVNADVLYAYRELLGDAPGQRRAVARIARLEPSCSGFILMLGVRGSYPQLAHHSIFFSGDYAREFRAIFEKGVPAPDPTVYVCATALSDPSHAPPGHLNLFVLVNAPALGGRVCWEREAQGYRDLVVRKLERMGLEGLEGRIVCEELWTPEQIAAHYNAERGAIYGLASNQMLAAFLRPPIRPRGLRGLYFVGGSTHPGGGIPLVLLSGKAVAERILS